MSDSNTRPDSDHGPAKLVDLVGDRSQPTTLANVTPPRDLRTLLPGDADHG